jgi:hypothetical protein
MSVPFRVSYDTTKNFAVVLAVGMRAVMAVLRAAGECFTPTARVSAYDSNPF